MDVPALYGEGDEQHSWEPLLPLRHRHTEPALSWLTRLRDTASRKPSLIAPAIPSRPLGPTFGPGLALNRGSRYRCLFLSPWGKR